MARRPSGLLDLPAYEGAVHIARFYLDRAEQAMRRLEKKGDEEALHDFRVSLRRLRSNLLAYAPYLATAVSLKRQRKIRKRIKPTVTNRARGVSWTWRSPKLQAWSCYERSSKRDLRKDTRRPCRRRRASSAI